MREWGDIENVGFEFAQKTTVNRLSQSYLGTRMKASFILWVYLICPSGKQPIECFANGRQYSDGDWENLFSAKF